MRLKHIGYVVHNIEEYLDCSFLESSTEPVYDPVQKARICFVDVGWGQDITLELIEPTETDSKVGNFLRKTGGGLHHLCFEVDNLEKAEEIARSRGMLRILGPTTAAALGGRRVIFYYSKNREILEFVENKG